MAISVADFRIRFPEFSEVSDYPDARIELFLDDAVDFMGDNESRWCGNYDKAQAYLAAHYVYEGVLSEVGDAGAKAGPIVGKSAGGVSVTRTGSSSSVKSDEDNYFLTTKYGQRFITYRDGCFVGIFSASLNG